MARDSEIPTIDFGLFLNGDKEDRCRVAAQVDKALSSVGFLYLRNHGIPHHLVEKTLHLSRQLFSCSESQKASLPKSSPSMSSGFSGVKNEQIRKRVCLKEGYNFGNPFCELEKGNWPPESVVPGLTENNVDFYQNCKALTNSLLDCLSLALNLPDEDSLRLKHKTSTYSLELIHYPAVAAELLRSGYIARAPAHSDFGTLTLLFQDDAGGLEVADMRTSSGMTSAEVEKMGSFIPVTPTEGTVVVNCGYLLMRWSNGRWKNTVHRVTAAPEYMHAGHLQTNNGETLEGLSYEHECPIMAPERYSIAFFSSPDEETVVKALPGCYDEDTPKKWKPINVRDYLTRKRSNVYT